MMMHILSMMIVCWCASTSCIKKELFILSLSLSYLNISFVFGIRLMSFFRVIFKLSTELLILDRRVLGLIVSDFNIFVAAGFCILFTSFVLFNFKLSVAFVIFPPIPRKCFGNILKNF